MEIERKWMVDGWPKLGFPVVKDETMRQGYLHADAPVVRIREEKIKGGEASFVLCFKSGGKLARKEIELLIEKDKFEELEELTGYPLIEKERITYLLPDGHHLEVNHVDKGLKTEFWYAEIEFSSVDEAIFWKADGALGEYLGEDVTRQEGSSMADYWTQTRLGSD